jgi:hypothetical protein
MRTARRPTPLRPDTAFLAGHRVVTFGFLGWGNPTSRPATTAHNQTGDLDTVITQLGLDRSSWSPTTPRDPGDRLGARAPARVAALVLLNTYYGWMPALHAPQAITLYSTPLLRNLARPLMRRFDGLNRRLYFWQVGRFIRDQAVRRDLLPQYYQRFRAARPAFWRLNADLHRTLISRARRTAQLRTFDRPVRIVFGAADPTSTPRRPPVRPTVPERAAPADQRCPPLRPGRRAEGSRRRHPHRGCAPHPIERQHKHSHTEHPTFITTSAVTVATPPATGLGARPSPRGDGAPA